MVKSRFETYNLVKQFSQNDRVCLLYRTADEQFDMVVPFFQIGIERGETCVYVLDDNDEETVLREFNKRGMDAKQLIKSGRLRVLDKKKYYVNQDKVDVDAMIELMQNGVSKTLGVSDRSAVRTAAETNSEFWNSLGKDFLKYTSKVNKFLSENNILSIMQYDVNMLKMDAIQELIQTNPSIIFDGVLYKNYYYISAHDVEKSGAIVEMKKHLFGIFASNSAKTLLQKIKMEKESAEKHYIRKGLEQEAVFGLLWTEKEKIKKFLDILGLMCIVISPDQRVQSINETGCRLLGYREEEIVGENWFDRFIPDRIREQIRSVFAKIVAGNVMEFEKYKNPVKRKDGYEVNVFWSNAVITDKTGKVLGTVSIGEDITEQEKAKENLGNANKSLNEKIRELEDVKSELDLFSYAIVNDFRIELRDISKNLNGFLMKKDTTTLEECKDCLKMLTAVVDIGQDMSNRIEALLSLSEIIHGEMVYMNVDLSALVSESCEMIREQYPGRKAEFIIRSGINVRGDPRFLRIAVEHLIKNSYRFATENNDVRVEFGIMQSNGKVVFFMKDNGVGFDSADVNKLFKPFSRLHSDEKLSGIGMGLAIVKHVITRHGGSIWAESEIGKGARFCFIIP